MTRAKDERLITIIGWIATFTSVCMYVSYIPQIIDNLAGYKGNPVQPFAAAINCSLWVIYGLKRKDYPLVAANSPGIIFGAIATVTAF
ncbi:hypothetical protein B9T31_05555 [Acinetobacter sp. ANC 4558]|uniref:SemiSWEET family transporter n=1 Tax=Acinetobacter sp. ANC 4558 TaxID=1977876 RepID=UPI000A344E3E|nr:SemiSWEET family transporter [Acinetobacter sp. ANC 4558]OTG87075.1 hypothetical protein B9T31_05555 [Acinetobacter sp. ANC 4558]